METYNGWANYETWNVALTVNNEDYLYRAARRVAMRGGGWKEFRAVAADLDRYSSVDGVAFDDDALDQDELDAMILEIGGCND